MNKKMKEFCKKKLKDSSYYTNVEYTSTLFNPITILLGPNGTGKSRSINNMEEELKSLNRNVISYSTHYDDIVRKYTSPINLRPEALASAFLSEGERMDYSFYTWVNEYLLPEILKNKSELFVLIDEADSGLSIDKMYEAFNDIIFIVKEERNRGRKIHLVISANSYELAEVFQSNYEITNYIWVPTKEYISLGSYNKFKRRYLEYYKYMNFDSSGNRRNDN